jgi:hypothetical protein
MNFTESETFSLDRLRDTLIRLEDTIIFGKQLTSFTIHYELTISTIVSVPKNGIAINRDISMAMPPFKRQISNSSYLLEFVDTRYDALNFDLLTAPTVPF